MIVFGALGQRERRGLGPRHTYEAMTHGLRKWSMKEKAQGPRSTKREGVKRRAVQNGDAEGHGERMLHGLKR